MNIPHKSATGNNAKAKNKRLKKSHRAANKSKPQVEKRRQQAASNELIRLNKFIAKAGICSRREADIYIQAGTIQVNGKPVTELGFKVKVSDKVTFDGKPILPEKKVYVLLNKPKNYITTSKDPQNRNTVMHLVSNATQERLFPVGRLDRNTTGLLLLTNDGLLAEKLMHPKNKVKKLYSVTLDKNFTPAHYQQMQKGFYLEDYFIRPDALEYVENNKKHLGVELHSGQNRIIRNMFAHLGYTVVKLDRVKYAELTKKNLPRGKNRFLTGAEVNYLQKL